MIITYLGHAGFCIETEKTIVLIDPWLSSSGAFDAAWFQFPKNHHLADYVRNLFDDSCKHKYIYISHEHKDHFDLEFLQSLRNRKFTFLLANFTRPVVKQTLLENNYQCKKIIEFNHNQQIELEDCELVFFFLDEEIDCDSAILVRCKTKSFLNLNDCKLHEMLPSIIAKYGIIDILAMQFSGAVWFPTCYDMYSQEMYETISASKIINKFATIEKVISITKPTLYLPSAGPACFLDPLLINKNFEKVNIFCRTPKLIEYLNQNCTNVGTRWPELMPGDTLDATKMQFIKLAADRVYDDDFESYVKSYANEYVDFFHQRELENKTIDPEQVFLALKIELENKLSQLTQVNQQLDIALYWGLSELPDKMYQVNFKDNVVTVVNKIENPERYWKISAPAWQVNKVLTRKINWPDFALTFRMKISRKPDIYNSFIHGFLTIDIDGLQRFCELLQQHHKKNERITIDFGGKKYSVLRYCPHQGGDLQLGWIDEHGCLVCPRHRWKFDIIKGGKCIYNNEGIEAICLDDTENKI